MKNLIITLLLLIYVTTLMSQELPGKVKENILRSVIKIEIPIKKSGKQPNGTGFLISRPSAVNLGQRQFFLVTNKHVVGDWNLADGNILNYFPKIDLFLYSKGNIRSKLFQKET